jgi:hypothetical protein
MNNPTIVYIRGTLLLTDALVARYVAAQQIQITRDFEPAWRIGATCVFLAPGAVTLPGTWEVLLLDHSDQADALGYHDDTGPGGMPRCKVFVADDLAAGNSWTVTASHETLEMLADPRIDRTVKVPSGDGTILEYAWEVCDCCEDDQFAYPIQGVHLSDFALPAWFSAGSAGPYTFRNAVSAPLALAEGGYIGVHEVSPLMKPWEQRLARNVAGSRTMKGSTSRTMRRFKASDTV